MSLWVTGLEFARIKAIELLDEVGAESPQDFAKHREIELREVTMDGAVAQLVVGPLGSHIVLSDKITEPAALRWSIAHELGHYELGHPAPPAAELCTPHPRRHRRRRHRRDPEDEADEFAMTLLMPPPIVSSICDAMPMTLDVVADLARRCRAPLSASAIRITEATFRVCAAVLSHHGEIRWVSPSLRFLAFSSGTRLSAGEAVRPGTLARRFFDTGDLFGEPALVPGSAWIDGLSDRTWIQEHSVETGEPGTVLTMLWASNEPDLPREINMTPRVMAVARDYYRSDERELAAFSSHVAPVGSCPSARTWFDAWMHTSARAAV